jgi:hypothetical protein
MEEIVVSGTETLLDTLSFKTFLEFSASLGVKEDDERKPEKERREWIVEKCMTLLFFSEYLNPPPSPAEDSEKVDKKRKSLPLADEKERKRQKKEIVVEDDE